MPTLHELLSELSNDELQYRLKFLDPRAKATRKAEMIEGIKAGLSGPGLLTAWNELDETSRLAVADAVHGSRHSHDAQRFRARYGRDAEFHIKPEGAREYGFWQNRKTATRLNLFLYAGRYDARAPVLPSDLVERLRAIAVKPAPVTVPRIPEPQPEDGRWVRFTESEALADLGSMLRLAETGKLGFGPKTGIPSKSMLPGIDAALTGGDWFPPELSRKPDPKSWDPEIGPIKPVGWTRMLHAAGLVSMSGSKSVLTTQGRRAIGKPAWEVIKAVWWKWITNKLYDEFNRIDIIKGQSVKGALTARVERRSEMLHALIACPKGEWISFDGFSNFMRADGYFFEVSNDPWKLYVSDREYGSLGYAGYGGWDVLQDRYMLCVLMEYAATLGIVDIAYKEPDDARPVDNWGMDDYAWLSRYDGLEAIRINGLGEYVLDVEKSDFQPSRPVPQVRLSVLGNRSIRVVSGSLSPAERTQLEAWAEPTGDDAFRADELRALDAVGTGQDPDEFARFLEARDDQPLPDSMIAFLKQARENGGALRQTGSAVLFECRDARTADLIANSKDLSKICLRAGETTLAVREDGIPKFRKQVRALGLGIV